MAPYFWSSKQQAKPPNVARPTDDYYFSAVIEHPVHRSRWHSLTHALLQCFIRKKEPYCPPNAVQNPMFESRTKLFFTFVCRLSVPSLGRPNCLKPTVPRTPFKILCLKVAQNQFSYCFLSTVRAKPRSPQLSEAYCPPNAVPNPMFESRTNSVF